MDQPAVAGQRRIRVLINPASGQKAGFSTNAGSEEEVRAVALRHGFGDDIVVTGSEEEAIAATQDAVRAGYFAVVAAGGDGTQVSVARALLDTGVALGVLPLGSVMNIARMLDIPRDLEAAAAVIADGGSRAIDVGEANGVTFLEGGSVGLNAALFAQSERIDAGNYSAIGEALRLMIQFRPERMTIHLDQRTITTRALTLTVSNGPYLGLGFNVAPDAVVDDGMFDVVLYSRFSRGELIRHFLSIAFGRRRYEPRTARFRAARVTIESAHPLPCIADMVDLGSTPVTYLVRPGALRVLVPATV